MYPNSVIIGPLLFAFSALGTIRIYCSHLGKKKKQSQRRIGQFFLWKCIFTIKMNSSD